MSVKTSYKSALLKVESGAITQKELDHFVEVGMVSQPRNGGGISVNPLLVEFKGKTHQVIPTLYFKGGSKIIPNTTEMNNLRTEVHRVIAKYTSMSEGINNKKGTPVAKS
jgi:hypothetical protein|tara:strand:+ start:5691 stop:6020 length:330 start_codon:yes stop_codon:yes gene_type:complete